MLDYYTNKEEFINFSLLDYLILHDLSLDRRELG